MLTFQEIIDNLNSYWKKKGCIQIQSYDLEMGAATFHPSTVLRVIDKEPWSAISFNLAEGHLMADMEKIPTDFNIIINFRF